ncbi:recQ-like DNA helicase Blm [Lytechinus pictus]|uniref:recQ-like DNA helicase Blm n=1 Tax=Lytechinus pictus TaxID=7653 RepID=UPI0030B9B769
MARHIRKKTCLVCFDEGHCISEWGLSFRPMYTKACKIMAIFNDVQTLLMTTIPTQQDYSWVMKGVQKNGIKARKHLYTPRASIVVIWVVERGLSYWQEVGMCARNIKTRIAVLYTYMYSRSLQRCDSTMKELVKQDQ